ncbi:MAG: hypothetical protein TREMPRED_004638 [Tremellales sp. Tagirdzhanova-0007]|nr:MAG: hypothetical protein TREMPRED_004638 [Tremellales sp. Tagirdzhanova-0007]
MSISLPNGTMLAAPSSQPQLSAAVTRILHLSKFAAELKTRDIQIIFKDWETDKGGFKIKWLDDVNALVVFADATVAKRAYLSLILSPSPLFLPPAMVRPYDRPDAAQIIQSLAARTMGHRASMSSALYSGSLSNLSNSDSTGSIHGRAMSTSINGMNAFGVPKPLVNVNPHARLSNPVSQRIGAHQRNGSASSSWGQSGAGVLNFSSMTHSSSAPRLPTHSETSTANPDSRSSSAHGSGDPVVGMNGSSTTVWKPAAAATRSSLFEANGDQKARRDSMSADKALREVQKALASVEA